MARQYGRILSSIWNDDDFTALTAGAQRLYLFLISQPKLSLCGVIDYMPRRWANTATGLTEHDIAAAINELEQRRFIVIDDRTDELLVRSFVRYDGITKSWPIVKSMWSSWRAVTSPRLRRAVLDELPDDAWTYDRAAPPDEAVEMRNTPVHAASEGPCEGPCEGASEGPCHTPIPPPPPPTEAAASSPSPEDAPSAPPVDRPTLLLHVGKILTTRRGKHDYARANGKGRKWIEATEHGIAAEVADLVDQLLDADPTMTAEQLADAIEPSPAQTPPPPTGPCPDCGHDLADRTGHARRHADWIAGIDPDDTPIPTTRPRLHAVPDTGATA